MCPYQWVDKSDSRLQELYVQKVLEKHSLVSIGTETDSIFSEKLVVR